MRTTLTLDDDVVRRLRRVMRDEGVSFKAVVNEVLRRGLDCGRPQPDVDVPVHDLGGPVPGVDLHKATTIAGEMEDEELRRRLELRK